VIGDMPYEVRREDTFDEGEALAWLATPTMKAPSK